MYARKPIHPIRTEISRLLEPRNYTAQSFLSSFADRLQVGERFNLQATREAYSVGEHTITFLLQLEKYFPDGFPGLSLNASRILGAVHDIGKRDSSDTREQHSHTLEFIRSRREYLPISDDEFRIICAVISEDSIGELIKNATRTVDWDYKANLAFAFHVRELNLNEVLRLETETKLADSNVVRGALGAKAIQIVAQSQMANMPPSDFLALMIAFTQIDISCYTLDAPRDPNRTFPNKELWIDDDEILVPIFKSEVAKACRAFERSRTHARCIPSLEGVFAITTQIFSLDPYSYDGVPIFARETLRPRLIFSEDIQKLVQDLEAKVKEAHLHIPLRDEANWCEMDVGDWGEPLRTPFDPSDGHPPILGQIYTTTGIDLRGISMESLNELRAPDTAHYGEEPLGDAIAGSPFKVFRAIDSLLINFTGFFRDVLDWQSIVNEILPEVLKLDDEVRIASFGCSTGEECLSIATLVKCLAPDKKVVVYGFDLDGESLSKARANMKDQRFLNAATASLHIGLEKLGIARPNPIKAKELYEMIEFRQANILQGRLSEGPFDLIICAALLPHYDPKERQSIIRQIEANLAPEGQVIYENYEYN